MNLRLAVEERAMKTRTFKIEGMRCEGCAETIKALAEKVPGVSSIAVSFAAGEACVVLDGRADAEDRLVRTIERPGFRVVGRR
jgi:copper chaperone CopZ